MKKCSSNGRARGRERGRCCWAAEVNWQGWVLRSRKRGGCHRNGCPGGVGVGWGVAPIFSHCCFLLWTENSYLGGTFQRPSGTFPSEKECDRLREQPWQAGGGAAGNLSTETRNGIGEHVSEGASIPKQCGHKVSHHMATPLSDGTSG